MAPIVFLSRPTALSDIQERAVLAWSKYLLELGFQLRRIERHQYTNMPWDRLRQLLNDVDGVVTFGYAIAPGHHDDSDPRVTADLRTSPWTHVEAAMAIEAAIPVLAVPEPGIRDGVFDSAVWSGCLYGVHSTDPPSSSAIPEGWIAAVRRASATRHEG
jgi:hypothetical protein